MPQEEASYHIQRCIDSGLWVPGGGDDEKNEKAGEGEAGKGDKVEAAAETKRPEDVYEQVD